MKRIKNIIYAAAALATMSFASCHVLDVDPIDSYSDAAAFGDLALAELVLNSSYLRVIAEIESNSKFSSLTDEIYQMHLYGTDNVVRGLLSPDTPSLAWPQGKATPWTFYYRAIKEVNAFLEKVEATPTPYSGNEEWKTQLKAEAWFLRAYFYHLLYSFYGRVPIITSTYALDTPEFKETRAPMAEVEAFIVAECEKAAAILPAVQTGNRFGRATKGAALAVKARVLMLAASELFDSNYPTRSKWQAAADAQKALIDLGVYSLKPIGDSDDYNQLFHDETNPEIIFQKLWDEKNVVGSPYLKPGNTPAGPGTNFEGWGVLQPPHGLVEKFQKSDGTPYVRGPETEYPWADRDLRLYANIFLDGSTWGYAPSQLREVELFTSAKIVGVNAAGEPSWVDDPAADKVVDGVDSAEGPGWWNATQTGYLVRKWLNINHNYNGTVRAKTPGIIMRMAEFYLNYAECQIELGNNDEALTYINMVRERALMPPAKGADIRAEYEYERQMELLFEGNRWWDLRRWKRIEKTYNEEPVTGLFIWKYNDGTKRYVVKTNPGTGEIQPVQARNFANEAQYWVPVPRTELRRAPDLDPAPYPAEVVR